MGFWQRLWGLFTPPDDVKIQPVVEKTGEQVIAEHVFGKNVTVGKPIGQATIVPDDQVDIFPSETNEEEPHDKTSQ